MSWIKRAYWAMRGRRVPSGFDKQWYSQYYKDVGHAGADPALHYLAHGMDEGRLPFCPAEFDACWYREQYPDIRSVEDPLGHYWHSGAVEGRDPGPGFSSSGYRLRYGLRADEQPLRHYLTVGKARGYLPLPELDGAQSSKPGAPTLLICGHQAGLQLYGAERSLLDILSLLAALPLNLVVTLPSAVNTEYVSQVLERAHKVAVLPYSWWLSGRASNPVVLNNFKDLVERYRVSAVYVNTLVLDEPLAVAEACSIPCVVHVRELPAHDGALCEALGATPAEIIERVDRQADLILANSSFTAKQLGAPDAFVVPNPLPDVDFGDIPAPSPGKAPLTVAMISSNLPKKGIGDFVALAVSLSESGSEARCMLIGPENEHTSEFVRQKAQGQLPDNLVVASYIPDTRDALAMADIVVNLSSFQESFGRTVLEAMAAQRPVIAYDWGALPELIDDGKTGYLVPLGDVAAVAERVEWLTDEKHRMSMGRAAKVKSGDYGREAVQKRLVEALQKVNILAPHNTP
ncbi:glycosyltransferase family 4 protein [Marinimicrobium alkaliphilum]|uniref:glycosyltransferase family 4 protein n=1 Tax=Marinimicrobium alkaliphilum TaxID=2202654 RepID=UPI000DBA3599|nr:glycosyltransferase family 4 protein [Marinimicrobium alkaliphilum]